MTSEDKIKNLYKTGSVSKGITLFVIKIRKNDFTLFWHISIVKEIEAINEKRKTENRKRDGSM